MHQKAWSKLKKSKELGGLGFEDLTLFNKALLAKQVWRILENPDLIISRIQKARYFKHTDIMDAPLGYNLSYIWHSLLCSREVLDKGLC